MKTTNPGWRIELARKAEEALKEKGYSPVVISDVRDRKNHMCLCASVGKYLFFSCGASINATVENLLKTVEAGLSVACKETTENYELGVMNDE